MLISLIMFSSCFSRWKRSAPADNAPRSSTVVSYSNFDQIDKDKDGVITKAEYIEEKEEYLESRDSNYLWSFLGIVVAVAAACCVPFVYMFTTKHVKLQWAKVAAVRNKEKNESSTEI